MFDCRLPTPLLRGSVAIGLSAALLCVSASRAAGQENRDEKQPVSTGMRVAQALDDPWPAFRVLSKHGGIVVSLLGKTPLGATPVAVYNGADLARQISLAAVEHDDKRLTANLIVQSKDAALLKTFADHGLDVSKDAGVRAAQARLKNMILSQQESSEGTLAHLKRVVQGNLGYALVEVGIGKAMSKGFEMLIGAFSREIDETLPLGNNVKKLLGNRGPFVSALRNVGWREFGARAALAKTYTDLLTHKLIQATLDAYVTQNLKKIWGEELFSLFENTVAQHPSQLRRVAIENPQLFADPAMFTPAMATPPPPMPAMAAPPPPPPLMAAPPPPAPAEATEDDSDPVLTPINTENGFIGRRGGYTPPASRYPTTNVPAPSQPAPSEPPPWLIRYREGVKCVGVQGKPGCGGGSNWDGRNGSTLTSGSH